ncbi:MAG: nucleoside hydrolase [Caldilineaceae bacterium]|nr:nucleoside hydrolase [Caldilineaceae bacterium]
MALALVLSLSAGQTGQAQSPQGQPPQSFRIPKVTVDDIESDGEPSDALAAAPRKIIVDTDPGVDDAAALIWLLSQRRYPVTPLGIVTVAGNTSLDNATTNALVVLSWLKRTDIPVIPGAAAPLSPVTLSSTGKLIHGPDGLWYLGWANMQGLPPPDSRAADTFYCQTLKGQESEVLVVALGPLTNIAKAMSVADCGVDWSQVQIVSLGGAKVGGNQTPATEFNMWQDPDAAAAVLGKGAQLTLVTLDGFSQFTIGPAMLKVLKHTGAPAMRALLPALQTYASVLSSEGGEAALPDPVAAMAALDTRLALGRPGLVKILGSDVPEYVRGQTVIALDLAEWSTLAATDARLSEIANTVFEDPSKPNFDYLMGAIGAILMENPPNATVVADILARQMRRVFLQGVTAHAGANAPAPKRGDAGSDPETSAQDDSPDYKLYLPGIQVGPGGQ